MSLIEVVVEYSRETFHAFWRWHFIIPRGIFWLMYLAGAGTLPLGIYLDGPLLWVSSFTLLLVGSTGIIRWAFYSTPPPALVVPLFATRPGFESRAQEVQRLIFQSLDDHLAASFPIEFIRRIPLVIGPDAQKLGLHVKRRLGALHVIYGEIRELKPQEYGVWARLLVTAEEVWHWDLHTRDFLPHRTGLRHLFRRLTPTSGLHEVEYPFEFAVELEALLRSLIGELAWHANAVTQAETHFRKALALVAESESPAIDHLRTRLATCVFQQGRRAEAIDLLRERASDPTASSELLMDLAALIGMANDPTDPRGSGKVNPKLHQEGEALLRRALDDRTNPFLDQAKYNLAMLLHSKEETQDEAYQLLWDLANSSSYYSRAWYVWGRLGATHWHGSERLLESGDKDRAREEARQAAVMYSKMLRLRPKFRLARVGRGFTLNRFPRRPILHANAFDAYRRAGNKVRAQYHDWRTHRLRRKEIRQAEVGMSLHNWEMAMAHFDWAIVGRRDHIDIYATVAKATALAKMGHQQ